MFFDNMINKGSNNDLINQFLLIQLATYNLFKFKLSDNGSKLCVKLFPKCNSSNLGIFLKQLISWLKLSPNMIFFKLLYLPRVNALIGKL